MVIFKTVLIYIFAPVKNKIYAISLLLSFLVVLSHGMIAHHHHEAMALDFSVGYVHDDDHEIKHPHCHDSQKENENPEHDHQFPLHHHISATNDVFIERTNLLESNIQIRDVCSLYYFELFRIAFYKPPKLAGRLYKEPPFLISSLSYLEAFALRGPPSII